MASYRCFFFNDAGLIVCAHEASWADDRAAVDWVRGLAADGHGADGFELWQGTVRVWRQPARYVGPSGRAVA